MALVLKIVKCVVMSEQKDDAEQNIQQQGFPRGHPP